MIHLIHQLDRSSVCRGGMSRCWPTGDHAAGVPRAVGAQALGRRLENRAIHVPRGARAVRQAAGEAQMRPRRPAAAGPILTRLPVGQARVAGHRRGLHQIPGHVQIAQFGAAAGGAPIGLDWRQIGGYFSLSRTRLITECYIASGAPSSDLPARAGRVSTWSSIWLNCSGRARNPPCSPGNSTTGVPSWSASASWPADQRGPACQMPMTLPAGSRMVAIQRFPSG